MPARVRQAAFGLVVLASTGWLAALVLAPLALSRPDTTLAARGAALAVQLAGAQVCHQLPHRSFHVNGVPMPVCARCTGLYLGAPLGLAAGVVWRRGRRLAASAPRRWLLLAALPTLASVAIEWGSGLSSGVSRAVTAMPLSGAVAVVVALALSPQREP